MMTANGVLSSSPLKAPAVEIVDLLSDNGSLNELKPEDLVSDDEIGDDQWSLYEDALAEMADDGPTDSCTWLETS